MTATHIKKLWPAALALPPFFVALYNPDLFWHLSAGQWIMEHAAVPRVDPFSIALNGTPWIDFEWLTQIFLYIVHSSAGMPGLWTLKCVLLAASAAAFNDILKLHGISGVQRSAGLVMISAIVLPYADIRPDLFSWILFLTVLGGLERRRLGLPPRRADKPVGLLLLFCIWSNLHAGFAMGLFLLGLYAVLRRAGWEFLVSALLGSLLNPYGWGPYRVILDHWEHGSHLAVVVREWSPLSLKNPQHGPSWVLLAALAAAAAAGWKKKILPAAPALAALFFAIQTLNHARMSVYFSFLAIPLILLSLPIRPRLWAVSGALYLIHLTFLISARSWGAAFEPSHVPAAAGEFMAQEQAAFTGKNVFCHWGWGGYLGWKLKPWHKPFSDGRYIFHSLLPEIREAHKDGDSLSIFLNKHGSDAALMENRDIRFPSLKRYPDGRTKSFSRPWYLHFFPRESWALVYWDPQALLFVRRKSFAGDWLDRREYRFVRPFDDEAFAEALALREIPLPRVNEETRRHDDDSKLFRTRMVR